MGVPRFLIGSLAGALAAPIVLLAACGGDDASIADPPVSPRPTSSSPTGTPPQESPEAFFRRFGQPYLRGHYEVNGNQLYVNRGLGFGRGGRHPRVDSDPELALFILRRAPEEGVKYSSVLRES